MTWTHEQYQRIEHLLPKPRRKAEIDNITFLNALQYVCEKGCRWRALPKHFGKWGTVYQRLRRWIDGGVFDRIEKELRNLHWTAVFQKYSHQSSPQWNGCS